jgi:hypothetical protein
MLALLGLQQLQDLELVQVSGLERTELNPRALDEAIAGFSNLRRLHVSAPTATAMRPCKHAALGN